MKVSHIEHLGVAVKSLDEAIPYWENVLGLKCYAIEEVADQKVRTAFFMLGQTKIELLEPTSEESTIAKYIENRGAGLRKHRGAARRRGGQGHPSDRQDPPQGRRGHDHRLPAPEIDPGHSDGALRKQKQIGL